MTKSQSPLEDDGRRRSGSRRGRKFEEVDKYIKRKGNDVKGDVVKGRKSREAQLSAAVATHKVPATARPPPTAHRSDLPAPRTAPPTGVTLRKAAKLPPGDWTGFNRARTARQQLRTSHQVSGVNVDKHARAIASEGLTDTSDRDATEAYTSTDGRRTDGLIVGRGSLTPTEALGRCTYPGWTMTIKLFFVLC